MPRSPSFRMNGTPPLTTRPLVFSMPSPQPASRVAQRTAAAVRREIFMARGPLIVAGDGETVRLGQQQAPGGLVDRVLDEADAGVAHADVHAAGVQAARLGRGHLLAVAGAAHAQ